MGRLRIVPLELRDANAFVEAFHRHHHRVQGHRFSLGVVDQTNRLHGVAIVGRPVARLVDARKVLEVTRLCTDGEPHTCSLLYAAAARVGKELGYSKIQTYILTTEPGTSLRAAGWIDEGLAGNSPWVRDSRPGREETATPRRRYARVLR